MLSWLMFIWIMFSWGMLSWVECNDWVILLCIWCICRKWRFSREELWFSWLNSPHANGAPRSRVRACGTLRSAPHWHERKLYGTPVCRVSFKDPTFHDFLDTLSNVLNTFPEVLDTFPDTLYTFTDFLDTFPNVLDTSPDVLDTFPEILDTFPDVLNTYHNVLDTFPDALYTFY